MADKTEQGDKLTQLFLNQKQTLDIFLEHHTITKQQYDKSLNGLMEKMKVDINGHTI